MRAVIVSVVFVLGALVSTPSAHAGPLSPINQGRAPQLIRSSRVPGEGVIGALRRNISTAIQNRRIGRVRTERLRNAQSWRAKNAAYFAAQRAERQLVRAARSELTSLRFNESHNAEVTISLTDHSPRTLGLTTMDQLSLQKTLNVADYLAGVRRAWIAAPSGVNVTVSFRTDADGYAEPPSVRVTSSNTVEPPAGSAGR